MRRRDTEGCQGREWSDRRWDEGSSSQTVGRQKQGQGALLTKVSSSFQKLGAGERQTIWSCARATKIPSFLLEFKGINTASQFTVLCC